MNRLYSRCPHCETDVSLPDSGEPRYCPECGHRADIGRLACTCSFCELQKEQDLQPGPAPVSQELQAAIDLAVVELFSDSMLMGGAA